MDEIIECIIRNAEGITLDFSRQDFPPEDKQEIPVEFGSEVKITGRTEEPDHVLDAVIWGPVPNIYFYPLETGKDSISFDFNGCLMAMYQTSNHLQIAHIHRGDSEENDTTRAWADFVMNNQITNLVMFRPNYDFNSMNFFKDDRHFQWHCWGIITQNRNCYTVFTENINSLGTQFRVKMILKHEVTDCFDLIIKMQKEKMPFEPMKKMWNQHFYNDSFSIIYNGEDI